MNLKSIQLLAVFSTFLIISGLILLGNQSGVKPIRGVYFWKTDFERSTYQSQFSDNFMSEHKIQKAYVKMLDVDWSEVSGIYPVTKTNVNYYMEDGADSVEYIPVVYITNRTLQHLRPNEIGKYANLFLIHALRIETYLSKNVNEIQLDCDWSEETKDIYFSLIKEMRRQASGYRFSATLRLYPLKYRDKLGVPPVNRVMVMMYNIENARELRKSNSIFNPEEAARYLKSAVSYPLPKDFAIPAFSWSVVFRFGQFYRILTNSPVADSTLLNRCTRIDKGIYRVNENTWTGNNLYLRSGDVLKIESCGIEEMNQARQLCLNAGLSNNSVLAVFDLDEFELKKLNADEIEKIYSGNN